MLLPGLVTLNMPERPVQRIERWCRRGDGFQCAEHGRQTLKRIGKDLLHARRQQVEHVDGQQHLRCVGQDTGIRPKQHFTDLRKGGDVAREPAAGIEIRCQIHRALQADAGMGRTQADQAAMAGRGPHRAAGVGAQRDIGQPVRDRRGRAGTRSAGDAIRCATIARRAEMRVLAVHRKGQFVGAGLADKGCACLRQRPHG